MFVRTKEKVYEVVEENERYYKCCYDDGCITLVAKFDNDVNGFSKALKTADTIEELCDEFVLFDKHFNTYGMFDKKVINYKWLKEHIVIYPSKLCIIYGAIWTDEGLIYIAKMNDKGEMELI